MNSGKDTIADMIEYLSSKSTESFEEFKERFSNYIEPERKEREHWKRKRFADALKDIVCILLGCTRKDLENRDFKEKELGEEWTSYQLTYIDKVGEKYSKLFAAKEELGRFIETELIHGETWGVFTNKLTSRKLLQTIGTEAGRQIIHPNIWVNATLSRYGKMAANYENWIIPDTRFPNEAEAIKEKDGIVIRVNRPGDIQENQHISETALDNYIFDYVIENDGTLDDLLSKVETMLKYYFLL